MRYTVSIYNFSKKNNKNCELQSFILQYNINFWYYNWNHEFSIENVDISRETDLA